MERLNYHHLYLFWTLAKEGTFTKTAEKLSIAQSAVTSQIKNSFHLQIVTANLPTEKVFSRINLKVSL